MGGEIIFVSCIKSGGEDHGADIFSGCRLKEIGSSAGAIADIIADEIGNDCGVARIVLRNSGFDLSDEIGSDIGGFRINSAAKLCKQRYKTRAESVADNEQRDLRYVIGNAKSIHDSEKPADSEKTKRHDEK